MAAVEVRAFAPADARPVQALFVDLDWELVPPEPEAAFEGHVARCIAEEISRIAHHDGGRGGDFWVAVDEVGALELRRMCAAARGRRRGVAETMLASAEMGSAVAEAGSNRTAGGPLRRFSFEKALDGGVRVP